MSSLEALRSYPEFEAFLAEFTNYERMAAYRYDAKTLGLDRMLGFLRRLDDPHLATPAVHVTGTKGKGTTTLILEALLSARTPAVGAYTSPHLEHIRERIRWRRSEVSEGTLVDLANRALPALNGCRSARSFPTFFELMTGLSMLHFRDAAADWAVYEVGLGGRLDATNVVQPRACVITSIGLEHTQLLGDTLAAIAREKAGILKTGVPAFTGLLPPEARAVVRAVAAERGAPLTEVLEDEVTTAGPGLLALPGLDEPVRAPAIRGPALRHDMAIAWALHRHLSETTEAALASEPAIRRTLEELQLPGRVEIFDLTPPVCLDGAHTVESIEALASTLDEIGFPSPRTLVFSLAADKRREDVLALLPRVADRTVFTRADRVRSTPPEELRALAGHGTVIEDPRAALEQALESGRAIVVTGSIYLAGALRRQLLELAHVRSREDAPPKASA